MKLIIYLALSLSFSAALGILAIAQETTTQASKALNTANAYHLIPAELSAETHPSNQLGYRSKEIATTEHKNGTLEFITSFQPPVKGTTKSKQEITKLIEVKQDSLLSYQRQNQGKKTSLIQGQEYPESQTDMLQGKTLLIDLKPEMPSIAFEDQTIVPTPKQKSFIQALSKEYQIYKTSNPWTPELLSYGKEARKVGETWRLKQEELKKLSQWQTQVQMQGKGSYQMKSLEVEFLELKEINQVPHAILELRGEFETQQISEDKTMKSSTVGSFQTTVERDLESFLERSVQMEAQGKFHLEMVNENGTEMKESSEIITTITEQNSLVK